MRRAWILWTSALLGLIAVAWMGAVVVVDVQAGREVAELKRRFPPNPERLPPDRPWLDDYLDAIRRIQDRGCPALPRLIDALNPADHPSFTASLSRIITTLVALTHGDHPDAGTLFARMNAMRIDRLEAPAERERKIRELRRWWKEEGSSRHPAWRFWTSGCPTPILDPEPRDP